MNAFFQHFLCVENFLDERDVIEVRLVHQIIEKFLFK